MFVSIPGFADFLISVFIHDEFCRLTGRIDDQRISVEPLQHDGVLGAKVIRGQGVSLPG